jgi:hypothetical protein
MISHNGHQLASCPVKNISMCGISVRSGPLAFYRNTKIEICFTPHDNTAQGNDCINAIVVRNSRDEVALMYDPAAAHKILRPIIRDTE